MTEPYDEPDAPPPRGTAGSTIQLLQYRLDSVERELRSLRSQQDRRLKEIIDDAQKRFKETGDDYQKRIKDLSDESEKRSKDVEGNFDKRVGRIESFLLGGLCLVATLFIGALFAITNGAVPGGGG